MQAHPSTSVGDRHLTVIQGRGGRDNRVTLAAEVALFMQHKRKRLTPASQRGYRSCLEAFVAHFPEDATLDDLAPPSGTREIEDFLDERWGGRAPRTYNKNLSIIHVFFEWQVKRGRIYGDPSLPIERAKARKPHRMVFTLAEYHAILAANPEPHDWLPLKLLLDYAIRRGALLNVRFRDFDLDHRRLTVFTKGETIHQIPMPDERFWEVLLEHMETIGAEPHHYLLPRQMLKRIRPAQKKELDQIRAAIAAQRDLALAVSEQLGSREAAQLVRELDNAAHWLELTADRASEKITRYPTDQAGEHMIRGWWYRCMSRAGIVEKGTTSGVRIHTARHTAIQRILDVTGNLKAAQEMAGHTSMSTTGDIYTNWGMNALNETMKAVIPA